MERSRRVQPGPSPAGKKKHQAEPSRAAMSWLLTCLPVAQGTVRYSQRSLPHASCTHLSCSNSWKTSRLELGTQFFFPACQAKSPQYSVPVFVVQENVTSLTTKQGLHPYVPSNKKAWAPEGVPWGRLWVILRHRRFRICRLQVQVTGHC